MGNIILIASIPAAFIWGLCYLLIAASNSILIILTLAFIGTAISIYINGRKQEISKQ